MLGFFLKIFFFIIVSLFLSLIPVNRSFSPELGSIRIYIVSNGMHTDFVQPIETPVINWKEHVPAEDFHDGWQLASHMAFGWGDRGFYLNTPEWKDLRIKTAAIALFTPSKSAMHVTLWPEPAVDDRVVQVSLTETQYSNLVNYIMDSFELNPEGQAIKVQHPGYGDYDLFFESPLKFHIFRTCNTWTGQGLKVAGVRTPLWTPYDRPILYQIRK